MKACLFDMDGTIIDSMPALTGLAVDVICTYYPVSNAFALKEYRETTGLTFLDQLENIFGLSMVNFKAAEEYYSRKVELTLDAPLIAVSVLALQNAHAENLITGLVSSTNQELVSKVVEKHNLKFNWTTGDGYWGNKPKQVYNFLSYYQLTPKSVNYYGDSNNDEYLANAFGMNFYKVKDGSLAAVPTVL